MSAQRLYPAPTPENVFARMRPGLTYSAHQVATRFKVSTAEIRAVLDAMVTSGIIELSRVKGTGIGFRRPAPNEPAEQEAAVEQARSVALPREPVKGNLTGYDAEIQGYVELRMSARRR